MPFRDAPKAAADLPLRLPDTRSRSRRSSRCRAAGLPSRRRFAAALDAPLDLILVRKVGVPFQPELAMGAVVNGGGSIIVRNEDVIEHIGIDEAAFKAVCDAEFAEIERGVSATWATANVRKSLAARRL